MQCNAPQHNHLNTYKPYCFSRLKIKTGLWVIPEKCLPKTFFDVTVLSKAVTPRTRKRASNSIWNEQIYEIKLGPPFLSLYKMYEWVIHSHTVIYIYILLYCPVKPITLAKLSRFLVQFQRPHTTSPKKKGSLRKGHHIGWWNRTNLARRFAHETNHQPVLWKVPWSHWKRFDRNFGRSAADIFPN